MSKGSFVLLTMASYSDLSHDDKESDEIIEVVRDSGILKEDHVCEIIRCHHDYMDFESDLRIEVAREGDILKEGQELTDIPCEKNPGHRGFIPFIDLTLEDLPEDVRTEAKLDQIKKWGSRVVRLVVRKRRNGEVITEVGTGFVHKVGKEYQIQTNFHVVQTDDEVKHCIVEFFYDSHHFPHTFTSTGVKLRWTCPLRDVSQFVCHPVPHDLDWTDSNVDLLVVIVYTDGQIVSETTNLHHESIQPHHFTVADLNDPEIDMVFLCSRNDFISYLSSSYFKFQPIPSNIQDITNIQIHVDEDDGNSTVISGDVVKFGDEYVVKISESIFQDKVKKCRLVWNGEVLRGTRLYFQQFQSREFFSDKKGVDFELCMELFPGNVCLFDCHPKPQELENYSWKLYERSCSDILCCIGHPHGGIKMVTFGRWLRTSLERFDNHGRRIRQPGTKCRCKEVRCIKYSCKTCPGSSGSPVLCLNSLIKGINPSHFMGEKVTVTLSSGEAVENINIAWTM